MSYLCASCANKAAAALRAYTEACSEQLLLTRRLAATNRCVHQALAESNFASPFARCRRLRKTNNSHTNCARASETMPSRSRRRRSRSKSKDRDRDRKRSSRRRRLESPKKKDEAPAMPAAPVGRGRGATMPAWMQTLKADVGKDLRRKEKKRERKEAKKRRKKEKKAAKKAKKREKKSKKARRPRPTPSTRPRRLPVAVHAGKKVKEAPSRLVRQEAVQEEGALRRRRLVL